DDLAKYCVAPAVRCRSSEVQEIVVSHVDEELCRSRMRITGASHCNGVAVVLEPVIGFVFDSLMSGFLLHARFESAALDHEIFNDPMEDGAVIEAFFYVSQKVFDGFWGFLGIELDDHVAHAGL